MDGFTGKLETHENSNWHFNSRQVVEMLYIFLLDQQILKLYTHTVELVIIKEQLNNRQPDQTSSLKQ